MIQKMIGDIFQKLNEKFKDREDKEPKLNQKQLQNIEKKLENPSYHKKAISKNPSKEKLQELEKEQKRE